ncbi:MAG: sensor histidine kinase [Thiothrix sp.]|nr:MAG: sensor histidine kinase [Thiothrix sp.]
MVASEKENNLFQIRPAARHIFTIGRDLIKDQAAALLELIKNAYDADSPDVHIQFLGKTSGLTLIIEDKGHGMNRDTVLTNWLVPSTDNKLHKKTSPKGRVYQGKKGIGRYAASLLGYDLLMETTTPEGEYTTIYIDWSRFEEAEFLDEVDILVETKTDKTRQHGTHLTIEVKHPEDAYWLRPIQGKDREDIESNFIDNNRTYTSLEKTNFGSLIKEIKKSKGTLDNYLADLGDSFDIFITTDKFLGESLEKDKEPIEPYPLFESFDYAISGVINSDGLGDLTYQYRTIDETLVSETMRFNYGKPTSCGAINIDLIVYERDAKSLKILGNRLSNGNDSPYSTEELRSLLNDYNGIGVYRGGFRIRPLGDPDFDWLILNKSRIQRPGYFVDTNQVIGYVEIEDEEKSDLREKSARDGLVENQAFESLKELCKKVLRELEVRRYERKRNAKEKPSKTPIEDGLDKLAQADNLKKSVVEALKDTDDVITKKVIDAIEKDAEEKTKLVNNVRTILAFYQGQATLGNIVHVVVHEGRKPNQAILQTTKNIESILEYKEFSKDTYDLDIKPKLKTLVGSGKSLSVLFKKIDPLSISRSAHRKNFNLYNIIRESIALFEYSLSESNIKMEIKGDENYSFNGWSQDILAIFTNLIDNSIYWLNQNNNSEKSIKIYYEVNNNLLEYIDYFDNGPGISKSIKDLNTIFEPQVSLKENGTGIGLAIAGECANRNDLDLNVFSQEVGVHFQLAPKKTSVEGEGI